MRVIVERLIFEPFCFVMFRHGFAQVSIRWFAIALW